ncbi:hypothetical protein [Lactobacillus johnsonii]|uniref:hypothetical protein n=1 Tax=Lactobacillus johnsonii TaxID=33959 RepID=UPI001FB1D6A2|nr:hypothetical protein [Lactobacillus johnsonii]UOC05452.1 hypothetical protein LC811_06360 [Lactobacillus johnsonii]
MLESEVFTTVAGYKKALANLVIKAAKQNKKISLLGIYLCDANSGGLDENEIQFFERIVKDDKKDGRKWVLRYPKTI